MMKCGYTQPRSVAQVLQQLKAIKHTKTASAYEGVGLELRPSNLGYMLSEGTMSEVIDQRYRFMSVVFFVTYALCCTSLEGQRRER